jgi:hypothetical protein
MSSNGGGDGGTAAEVDDFLESVGERVGSVVAGFVRWSGQLVNTERPPRERAEAVVSGIEEQLSDYTASFGHGVRRVAARAKEELDDIRAEAALKKESWTADGSEKASAGEENSAEA